MNIFCQYEGNSRLENNITKAFIHTIESMDNQSQHSFLEKLLNISIPSDNFSIECYLQTKPVNYETKVQTIDAGKRYLFAFSPTGKAWTKHDIDGIDTKDFSKAKPGLETLIKNQYSHIYSRPISSKELKQQVEEQWDDILEVRKNTGSIPDGWIFIYCGNTPYAVIILENKLFDLDPYQLNNHIEKSLFILSNKPKPIYATYQSIFDKLKPYEDQYLVNQFLGYLVILGYIDSSCLNISFSDSFNADSSIRNRLINPWIKQILSDIAIQISCNNQGTITNRKRQASIIRLKVEYEYLKEINITLNEKDLSLGLSFGSTMKSGSKMLSKIRLPEILKLDKQKMHITFHVSRHVSRNAPVIRESYIYSWNSIQQYFDFLQQNKHYLSKQQTMDSIVDLYNIIKSSNLVQGFDFNAFFTKLDTLGIKCQQFLVVPEITYSPTWTYHDIAILGQSGFQNALLDEIKLALKAFGF